MSFCMRSRCAHKTSHIWPESETHRTHRTSSVPHSHSPALRVWITLLVKRKREAKEGARVSQLMQCVSSIQVKAPDLSRKGQHTQNKGSPQFRGIRWEGTRVPMSHQGCHSGVQVFWQSKFNSRRAQRRFLLWVPESQRAVRGNPAWASSALLSSLDACLVSLALLRCLSTPFAAVSLESSLWKCGCYYYVCKCASLNACAPPPPLCSEGDRGQVPWIARSLLPLLSLSQAFIPSSLPSSLPPSFSPLSQLTSTLKGLVPKYQARLSGYLEAIEQSESGWKDSRLFYLLSSHAPKRLPLWPPVAAGACTSE